MAHFRVFVFIPDLLGIYHQLPFLSADAWCRTVYHVPDLQYKVVEVVRLSSVKLETQQAAVVLHQLVRQSGVCPFAVESFVADDDQDVCLVRAFVELFHPDLNT